jgi:hypothetical protein
LGVDVSVREKGRLLGLGEPELGVVAQELPEGGGAGLLGADDDEVELHGQMLSKRRGGVAVRRSPFTTSSHGGLGVVTKSTPMQANPDVRHERRHKRIA